MDKYQTLGKVGKVGNIFGLILLLLNSGKVGKVLFFTGFENQWKCLILSPFMFLARNREEKQWILNGDVNVLPDIWES